ncbi:hypothetical protein SAMN04490247_0951 [Salimicrobium halophilum]|uniref:Uncharacterized protein n=1 Tax=Salimicrobium halophilum TaxID=86666 RepID=A0A1G8RCH3_9BACI|nr:hypothetical protein SAMN04490247_0951 [Salimicrobium halophilum]
MKEKLSYIFYWLILLLGIHSFWQFFFVEYGFVYTMIFTFSCGFLGLVLAMSLRSRILIAVSASLLLSPYLLLVVMNII